MRNPATEDDRAEPIGGGEPEVRLDLRGLKCPLPVLRTRRALLRLVEGASLEVWCTDPLAGLDIPHLLRETGDTLVSVSVEGSETRIRLRKGQSARSSGEDPSRGADVDGHR